MYLYLRGNKIKGADGSHWKRRGVKCCGGDDWGKHNLNLFINTFVDLNFKPVQMNYKLKTGCE